MAEKIYWKGLEEKEQNPEFIAAASKEFSDELPVLRSVSETISTKSNASRRDFLKMLGFSVTAATIAASCEMPVRKSIPYIWKPEELVPGVASYYATVYAKGGDYCAVMMKAREGRPIKVEGNKLSSVTKGGTNARAQASVLSLYDGARYKNPVRAKENISWEKADAEIGAKLNEIKASGGKIALITSSVFSPSAQASINAFKAAFPVDHIEYDAISYSGMLDANAQTFGVRALPEYHFDKAEVIVGIGCDFLGSWLNPVEFSADWAVNRRVNRDHRKMSRHYQIEAIPTITGFKADTRIPVKPAEELQALSSLHAMVTGSGSVSMKNKSLEKAAADLKANAGKSLVVCGSNNPAAQILVNSINNALGNYGNTLSFARTLNLKKGNDKSMAEAIAGIGAGTYQGVIFWDVNPVFSHPAGDKLAEALKKSKVSVSLSERRDETSLACAYVAPSNHFLESWGDAEPKSGVLNTIQPVISKLFDTRQAEETLLRWSGNTTPIYDFVRSVWQSGVFGKQSTYSGFNALWDNTVHDGEFVLPESGSNPSYNNAAEAAAAEAVATAASKGGEAQLVLYSSIAVADGYGADNPWLQELPDPVTKVAWGNYLIASPKWVKAKGLEPDLATKEYPLVKVTANGKSVTIPVVAVPGTPEGAFGIALGYGRSSVEHEALQVGVNAWPLAQEKGAFTDFMSAVTVEPASGKEKLAITQTHHNLTLMGLGGVKTRKIVKETTLEAYQKDLHAGNEDRAHILEEMVTLYYEHAKPGHHWKMSVDLNTCTGCGACVTACNSENNIPVVGKDQVIRSREMHWLRIDRYFTGSEENPDAVFQPMLCQHCDNAPCENVCPVAATNHSSEGLNQMTYNRCIGTRYCANNCPYKVRRFNWYDYSGADSFTAQTLGENYVDIHGTLEPLTRMVLNPDVSVRSRGVIEKCSFCVQRLQEAKLGAKKENRTLRDGDARTACQTACPTNAIVFGDGNDKESKVFALLNDERTFGVIEEIHTMPNVTYLTQVRNRTEDLNA